VKQLVESSNMKSMIKTLLASAALVGIASNAWSLDAAAAKTLAAQKACLGCHAVDKKLVGPSYQDVAAKYKGMAPQKLAAAIKAGGGGKWGPIPMPPQPTLTDAQAELLAAWILAGAPQ
jgi:cytochrome c